MERKCWIIKSIRVSLSIGFHVSQTYIRRSIVVVYLEVPTASTNELYSDRQWILMPRQKFGIITPTKPCLRTPIENSSSLFTSDTCRKGSNRFFLLIVQSSVCIVIRRCNFLLLLCDGLLKLPQITSDFPILLQQHATKSGFFSYSKTLITAWLLAYNLHESSLALYKNSAVCQNTQPTQTLQKTRKKKPRQLIKNSSASIIHCASTRRNCLPEDAVI